MRLHNALIIIFLVSFVLVVAGCSTQVSKTPTGQTTNDAVPTLKTVDISQTNKNITEQHQATLAALVPDGVYIANETYEYHSGMETVTVSVTLKNDVITAASVSGNNPNRVSARYINGVNAALPDLVVGKRIDQLDIPRQVSGSSLTTAAVRQYLESLITS